MSSEGENKKEYIVVGSDGKVYGFVEEVKITDSSGNEITIPVFRPVGPDKKDDD